MFCTGEGFDGRHIGVDKRVQIGFERRSDEDLEEGADGVKTRV